MNLFGSLPCASEDCCSESGATEAVCDATDGCGVDGTGESCSALFGNCGNSRLLKLTSLLRKIDHCHQRRPHRFRYSGDSERWADITTGLKINVPKDVCHQSLISLGRTNVDDNDQVTGAPGVKSSEAEIQRSVLLTTCH
jgi:hypothetical protein